MTAIAALRLPLDVDLSGFVGVLQRLQVPHRVSEEVGEQVLWVPSEQQAIDVRELYRRFPECDPRLQAVVPAHYAFVIHTKNPSNNDETEVFCEMVRGLGECLGAWRASRDGDKGWLVGLGYGLLQTPRALKSARQT